MEYDVCLQAKIVYCQVFLFIIFRCSGKFVSDFIENLDLFLKLLNQNCIRNLLSVGLVYYSRSSSSNNRILLVRPMKHRGAWDNWFNFLSDPGSFHVDDDILRTMRWSKAATIDVITHFANLCSACVSSGQESKLAWCRQKTMLWRQLFPVKGQQILYWSWSKQDSK